MLRTRHLAATRRPAAAAGPDPDTERPMVTQFEKTLSAHGVDRKSRMGYPGGQPSCYGWTVTVPSAPRHTSRCRPRARPRSAPAGPAPSPATALRRAASHTSGGSLSHSCCTTVTKDGNRCCDTPRALASITVIRVRSLWTAASSSLASRRDPSLSSARPSTRSTGSETTVTAGQFPAVSRPPRTPAPYSPGPDAPGCPPWPCDHDSWDSPVRACHIHRG